MTVLVLALLATGVVMHGHEPVVDTDELASVQLHRAATVVHGLFAWIFCVVVGRWIWPHAVLVWSRRNGNWIWALGIVTAVVGGVGALTGLALLYGPADWREALTAVHWWAGLAWPVACLSHAWKWIVEGRGQRR
ncbi:hypothetical protein [Variovorax sp. YR216]|uniref:hypothetical protein n=1 Tax=Variovorax sp. YR216 TaxID=1882828 RepID=UPI00115FE802|nr:hypothetical protein [Variovorax sp. YR216]